MTNFIVRTPSETEIDAIIEMGKVFWSHTLYASRVPYDVESVKNTVYTCLDHNLLLVAFDGDKIAGFIGGVAAPIYANNDILIGQELFWWVQPEYRNKGAGQALMDAIEKNAKDEGLTYWTMMYLVNIEPEKAKQVYVNRGYYETEIGFTKEIK